MPRLKEMIRKEADLSRVAFLVASYYRYLTEHVDEKGNAYEIDEPRLTEADKAILARKDHMEFLSLSPFASENLQESEAFVTAYLKQLQAIREWGIPGALERLLEHDDNNHPLESAPSTRA